MMTNAIRWGAALTAALVITAGLSSPASAVKQHSKSTKSKKVVKAAPKVTWAQVQPIFKANCVKCHSGMGAQAKMHLDSYKGVMAGNDHGEGVKPGNPSGSLLSKMIHRKDKKRMPPPPIPALSAKDAATIDAWIKAGAKG